MERSNSMTKASRRNMVVCSAMAAVLLAGCAGKGQVAASNGPAPSAEDASASALAKAEARVAKSPRNGSARLALAQLYLAQGRFTSAATTLEDAISLGQSNARSNLGLALAYAGSGRSDEALAVLAKWRDQIPASDYGLALALAGRPAQGVDVLTDVVRGGEANAKTRQNLAYAYALNGRWSQARLIASQDLAPDQLEIRLSEWASRARPDQGQARVAGLIGAPLRNDPGQPAALALNQAPHAVAAPALAVADEPASAAPASAEPAPAAELPPVQSGESFWGATQPEDNAASVVAAVHTPIPAQSAFATVAPKPRAAAPKVVAKPAPKKAPAASKVFTESFSGIASAKGGSHAVQLGSFASRAGAERSKEVFLARNPALKGHTLRVTEALVNGKRYYRVAAEGFDRASARSACGSVKNRGGACIAYQVKIGLPGAAPAARPEAARLAQR